jgi:hypothetical protein
MGGELRPFLYFPYSPSCLEEEVFSEVRYPLVTSSNRKDSFWGVRLALRRV